MSARARNVRNILGRGRRIGRKQTIFDNDTKDLIMENYNDMTLDEKLFYKISSIPCEFKSVQDEKEKLNTIIDLLNQGANLYYRHYNIYWTYTYELPIMRNQPISVFKTLLDYGLDPNSTHPDDEMESLLAQCIFNNKTELVQLLVEKNVKLHEVNLYRAIAAKKIKIIAILLGAGVPVSHRCHQKILDADLLIEWENLWSPLRNVKNNNMTDYDLLMVLDIPEFGNIEYLKKFDLRVLNTIRSKLFNFKFRETNDVLFKYVLKYNFFNNDMSTALKIVSNLYQEIIEYESLEYIKKQKYK